MCVGDEWAWPYLLSTPTMDTIAKFSGYAQLMWTGLDKMTSLG